MTGARGVATAMPKQSIATRVAIAAGTASAVAALVGALATGIFAYELLVEHAEDAAHSTAAALANELHEESSSGPAHERIADEIVHFGRIEARYVVIEHGEEVFRSPRVETEPWPAAGACRRVEASKSIACTSEAGAIRVVALVTLPADEGTLLAVALVAASLAALIGFAVAWRSTRSALEPLPRLARSALTIRPGRLEPGALGPDDGLEEIDALREQLLAAFERGEEALRTVSRFGANAAHELRAPLATLRAELELGIDEGHLDVIAMQELRERVVHLSDLIERLLMLSLPRERALQVHHTVSLRDIAEDVVASPATSLDAAGRVRATLSADADPGQVDGDPALLRTLVENAIGNACKYAASRAVVHVRRDGEDTVLEVDDDGPGLDDDDLVRVFEPFFRTARAQAAGVSGHGLGLALVRHVAEMHGGTVTMSRAPLGGARLSVRLPASLA